MNKLFFAFATVLLAISIRYLLYTEIIPYLEYNTIPSLKGVAIKHATPIVVEKEIYFGKMKKGSSKFFVLPSKDETSLGSIMNLDLGDAAKFASPKSGPLQFSSLNVTSKTRIIVDKSLETKMITMDFNFGGFGYTVTGTPAGPNRFNFVIDLGTTRKTSLDVELSSDDILAMNEYSIVANCGKPYVGKKWKIRGFKLDPIQFKPSMIDYYAVIDKLEDVALLDHTERLFRIEIREKPSDKVPTGVAFANTDGDIVCEEFSAASITYRSYLIRERPPTQDEIEEFEKK